MRKIEAGDPLAVSHDAVSENISKLGELFPDVMSERGVDLAALHHLLGYSGEEPNETFGLTWPGKYQARGQVLMPSAGTLLPWRDESVSWESTRNIIIEGDNLDVLKLMQRSYANKVKLIYIDPPYNTGKDFVYRDDFRDTIGHYLQLTEQVESDGRYLTTNPDTSGRFHTDWLNMMYPRLKLARNLLRDDGIFIVSISDAEVHNLRCVMDELFGGENLMGCVVWNSTKSVTNTALLSVSHTYNLIYARRREYFVANRTHFRLKETGEGFTNSDNDSRGPWKADPFQVGGQRPNQMYTIVNPKTGIEYKPLPGNCWKNEKSVFDTLLADGRIVFGVNGKAGPQRKRFLSEAKGRGRAAKTWWDDVDTTARATAETKQLMGGSVFDYPKPVSLIRKFIQLGIHDHDDAIVLDFFAGSGTTGQAVVEENLHDGGNRRYILVQYPEPLDSQHNTRDGAAKYCDQLGKPRNLATLTRERMRRFHMETAKSTSEGSIDSGFRAFRLARSNMKTWDPDPEDIEHALLDHVENIRESRDEEDILYELLLKYGVDLCEKLELRKINEKRAFATPSGRLYVMLASSVCNQDIDLIVADIMCWNNRNSIITDPTVVFRDDAFSSDAVKVNIAETLMQHGINDVRSL